jgi:hypothetical protein
MTESESTGPKQPDIKPAVPQREQLIGGRLLAEITDHQLAVRDRRAVCQWRAAIAEAWSPTGGRVACDVFSHMSAKRGGFQDCGRRPWGAQQVSEGSGVALSSAQEVRR